ncbi:MAG: hypothetical protein K2N80_14190 [Lachnospiraceae bacterium]|nr:hypothetical protein [Lachnospiraceae bacterium]
MDELHKVKNLIKQIVETKFVSKKALTNEQKIIGNEIQKVSYHFFTEIKAEHPSYTIDKNPLLKKYSVNDETDGILESQVLDYFLDNSEAFYELVAYKFCGKRKRKKYYVENHIFYMRLFSNICSKEYDLYFVNKNFELYLFENDMTNVFFIEYINDYFIELPDEVVGKIRKLLQQKDLVHYELQEKLNAISEEINRYSKGCSYKLQNGAITFMDFLGWKGLWQSSNRNHLETVSELIQNIEMKVQEFTYDIFEYSSNLELSKLISISDTIAIFTPKLLKCDEVQLLKLHAKIAKYILEECVTKGYPIRGAITFGEYNTKNNIMIGPGIDECASWHETCNWIGVHFTPSAEFLINAGRRNLSNLIVKEDKIPVKNGYPKVAYCVKWIIDKEKFMELTRNVKALLPEISSKYMNTYSFLYREEDNDGKNGIS